MKRHKGNIAWGWGWVKMSPNLIPSWDAAWRNGVSLCLVPFKATPWIACTIYKSILVLALKCLASFKRGADSLSARLLKFCKFFLYVFKQVSWDILSWKLELILSKKVIVFSCLTFNDFQCNKGFPKKECLSREIKPCKAQKSLPGVNLSVNKGLFVNIQRLP